jgi:hypothetical protein
LKPVKEDTRKTARDYPPVSYAIRATGSTRQAKRNLGGAAPAASDPAGTVFGDAATATAHTLGLRATACKVFEVASGQRTVKQAVDDVGIEGACSIMENFASFGGAVLASSFGLNPKVGASAGRTLGTMSATQLRMAAARRGTQAGTQGLAPRAPAPEPATGRSVSSWAQARDTTTTMPAQARNITTAVSSQAHDKAASSESGISKDASAAEASPFGDVSALGLRFPPTSQVLQELAEQYSFLEFPSYRLVLKAAGLTDAYQLAHAENQHLVDVLEIPPRSARILINAALMIVQDVVQEHTNVLAISGQ